MTRHARIIIAAHLFSDSQIVRVAGGEEVAAFVCHKASEAPRDSVP